MIAGEKTRFGKKTGGLLPPKSDVVFKLLFGDERNADLLIDLLKAVLDLPSDEYEKIEIVDPHLLREAAGDKLGVLDVKLKTKSGKLIDIEIQVCPSREFKARVAFYVSKMVTEQIGSGDAYDIVKQAIGIVITDFELIEGRAKYRHRFTLYDKSDDTEFTDLLQIHTLELPKLPKESDDTELWAWLRFIGAEEKEEMDMLAQTNPQIEKAVAVLARLSADERARMLYESREKARRDEASRMKSALRDGMEKGLAEGKAEGKTEGLAEGKAEVAKNALAMGLADDQIEKLTGLSRAEIEKLRNALNRELAAEDVPSAAPRFSDLSESHWAYTDIIEAAYDRAAAAEAEAEASPEAEKAETEATEGAEAEADAEKTDK
ncbi:MAG: Rpn family recombination-promoting nuclease/putative transposase [Clostridiales Family XIII bacterium]|jgi:predicted transposase/invertase (TIGR01784 family)|nr:Rpn family recombination-promoting nuclease/putative transposase [Clostridiales Family XIII bacterium]